MSRSMTRAAERQRAPVDIEDRIRDKEAKQCFDRDFIELARAVYVSMTSARRSRSASSAARIAAGEESRTGSIGRRGV